MNYSRTLMASFAKMILIVAMVGFQYPLGAETATTESATSIERTQQVDAPIRRGPAIVRSVIFPRLGQVYKGDRINGHAFSGVFLITFATGVFLSIRSGNVADNSEARGDLIGGSILLLSAGGVYAANVFDAAFRDWKVIDKQSVSGHVKDVDLALFVGPRSSVAMGWHF